MKQKYWNIFLLIIFIVLTVTVFSVGIYYKSVQSKNTTYKQYNKLATSLTKKFDTLVKEKKNSTLAIGLTLSQNQLFRSALINKQNIQKELFEFSNKLRQKTNFKNVWIQLIDNKNIVLSRSWNNVTGDTVKGETLKKIETLISVDKYDLNFKVSVPLYDKKDIYLGSLEVITHFNSIANKMSEIGFESIILVEKKYSEMVQYPFSNIFIKSHYVANKWLNQEILNYARNEEVTKLLNYTSVYTISNNNQYLIVNKTIYGKNKQQIAHALMFKKIKDINTDSINNINYVVNIFTIFSIIIIGFLLLILADREKNNQNDKIKMIKYIILFSITFITLTILYYILLNLYKNYEIENYLKDYNNNIENDYKIIDRKFETVAKIIFETTLNNQEVLKIVKKAYSDEKDSARDELFNKLINRYNYFKKYNVRQLHFHLKNNESFLRFHRPKKYGDDLTNIRATVKMLNQTHKPVKGFEEGRIYNGFRYVFPLKFTNNDKENEHLGSVEVSFSAHAVANEFANAHHSKTAFLISKHIVKEKVFNEEQSNYQKSELSSFYFEKSIKHQIERAFNSIEIKRLSKKNIQLANDKIFNGESFSLVSKDSHALFTFLPIKNPISKKIIATIILQMDNKILEKQNDFFIILFVAGIFIILFVMLFMFRELTLKLKFLDLSLKTQRVLDTQKSIVVITNGKLIHDVNKKFLEFFNYDDLNDFKVKYKCICDCFIENEHYFHLKKIPDNTTWVHFLEKAKDKDRVVLIKDSKGKKHSFTVSISHYKQEYFIVSFTDISGTIQEQFTLENKVIHDKLTGVYNREFFEKKIENLIINNQSNNNFLGIILFDIDDFKKVNDTYGHNVGDDVLKDLSKRILNSIRENDYLIRWGGEEFIILLYTNSLEQTKHTAEHLRSMVEHHKFKEVKKITCSFGATLYLNEEPIKETIKRADEALYISKDSGKNIVTAI